jgi:hypothetical protein
MGGKKKGTGTSADLSSVSDLEFDRHIHLKRRLSFGRGALLSALCRHFSYIRRVLGRLSAPRVF